MLLKETVRRKQMRKSNKSAENLLSALTQFKRLGLTSSESENEAVERLGAAARRLKKETLNVLIATQDQQVADFIQNLHTLKIEIEIEAKRIGWFFYKSSDPEESKKLAAEVCYFKYLTDSIEEVIEKAWLGDDAAYAAARRLEAEISVRQWMRADIEIYHQLLSILKKITQGG